MVQQAAPHSFAVEPLRGGSRREKPGGGRGVGQGEEISMADRTNTTLTDSEAQEFHGIFVSSFVAFTSIVVVAHILVWLWRPWL
jgi:light-harvesting complex 1 beta chain